MLVLFAFFFKFTVVIFFRSVCNYFRMKYFIARSAVSAEMPCLLILSSRKGKVLNVLICRMRKSAH